MKDISYISLPVVSVPPLARKLTMTATPIMSIGAAVLTMPREMPPMMVVAAPVSVAFARFCVGLYVSEV